MLTPNNRAVSSAPDTRPLQQAEPIAKALFRTCCGPAVEFGWPAICRMAGYVAILHIAWTQPVCAAFLHTTQSP